MLYHAIVRLMLHVNFCIWCCEFQINVTLSILWVIVIVYHCIIVKWLFYHIKIIVCVNCINIDVIKVLENFSKNTKISYKTCIFQMTNWHEIIIKIWCDIIFSIIKHANFIYKRILNLFLPFDGEIICWNLYSFYR